MKTFVALVSETLAAEFPTLDLTNAFKIFDVSSKTRATGGEAPDHLAETQDCAARLCQAFNVPLEPFLQEFWDHQAIATHHAVSHDTSSFLAWKESVRKTQSRSSERHPSGHLSQVLMRLGAWGGCTTSGVEQQFSQLRSWIGPERECLGADLQRCELKMLSDYDRCGSASVNRLAAAIWPCFYGTPRMGCATRLDKGVKRRVEDCLQPAPTIKPGWSGP